MLFWIPDPALWDDPGPVPYRKITRLLWLDDYFPVCDAWIDVYRAYYGRLQREQEEMDRYFQQQADYEALMAEYEAQGEHMAEMLPLYLHKLRLSYKRTVQDRKHEGRYFERIDYCGVSTWYYDENAYYFQVDTADLPYGTNIKMFLEPEVGQTLSSNFNSTTTVEHNVGDCERPGLWVIVEHRAGRGLIPRHVDYGRMVKAMPKTAPLLLFPVGAGMNGRIYFADMDEMITVLIAGSRGSGKSNTINTILCTWLKRVPPADLRLFLTDLKGGLEFDDYSGIPHLGGDIDLRMRLDKDGPLEAVRLGQDISVDPHQVIPVLKYMAQEMERRQNIMRGKARKITAYNRKFKKRLSYWVLVVDELATLMDSSSAKDARVLLGELARKGRATGIFLILATQIPDKHVLCRQVAGNMDCRLVGRLADGASSAISLGDGSWDATRLPKDIPGRLIWRWAEKVVVQAPLISDLTIKQTIKAVKSGAMSDAQDAEDTAIAEEIFTYALEDLGGLCSRKELYRHFRNRIAQHKIETILKQWQISETPEGLKPIIPLGDNEYYLLPSIHDGNNGRLPRQLMDAVDFEQKKEEWLEIIRSRTAHGARRNGNIQGVNGQNSKIDQTGQPKLADKKINEMR